MTYNAMVEMANSGSLRNRVTAAAAESGAGYPPQWASDNIWKVVDAPGWALQWASATDGLDINQNPDLGIRTDVITDDQIRAQVQSMLQANPG